MSAATKRKAPKKTTAKRAPKFSAAEQAVVDRILGALAATDPRTNPANQAASCLREAATLTGQERRNALGLARMCIDLELTKVDDPLPAPPIGMTHELAIAQRLVLAKTAQVGNGEVERSLFHTLADTFAKVAAVWETEVEAKGGAS